MQDCFRKYPEVYGEEIAEEEAAEAEAAAVASGSPTPSSDSKQVTKDATTTTATPVKSGKKPAAEPKEKQASATNEFSTEEYKAGPTDAPKGGHPTAPAAAEEKSVGDGTHPSPKEESEGGELGIPRKSFDATSANASVSK